MVFPIETALEDGAHISFGEEVGALHQDFTVAVAVVGCKGTLTESIYAHEMGPPILDPPPPVPSKASWFEEPSAQRNTSSCGLLPGISGNFLTLNPFGRDRQDPYFCGFSCLLGTRWLLLLIGFRVY